MINKKLSNDTRKKELNQSIDDNRHDKKVINSYNIPLKINKKRDNKVLKNEVNQKNQINKERMEFSMVLNRNKKNLNIMFNKYKKQKLEILIQKKLKKPHQYTSINNFNEKSKNNIDTLFDEYNNMKDNKIEKSSIVIHKNSQNLHKVLSQNKDLEKKNHKKSNDYRKLELQKELDDLEPFGWDPDINYAPINREKMGFPPHRFELANLESSQNQNNSLESYKGYNLRRDCSSRAIEKLPKDTDIHNKVLSISALSNSKKKYLFNSVFHDLQKRSIKETIEIDNNFNNINLRENKLFKIQGQIYTLD